MSTDTQNSQNQGTSRRRRSRGGQNRSKNNNTNRSSQDGRQSSSGSSHSGRQSSGKSQQQRRAMPTPAKLSWWQKLLNIIGLGKKEPVRPPRPERRPSITETKQTREPRRSKTRDARTDQGSSSDARDNSEDRKQGRERSGKSPNRPRGGDPATVENRRVYIGNLSYDTTESDLEELFKGVGAVRRVEIVYNRSTHRSKGYGFIEMLDIDEAKRTVEVLNDQFFMGRKITVSGAKSKDYDDAEKAEGGDAPSETSLPTLAPINPIKEEVLDLIDHSGTTGSSEPLAETAVEDSNSEVPTEEFSPQENTAVESQEEIKA
jgi:hypothetical protein